MDKGQMLIFKRGSEESASKHFKFNEFECHCSRDHVMYLSKQLLDKLELLRSKFKKPIHINSAYRCAKHNKAIGGSPKSQHMRGTACDIRVDGMTPIELAKLCENLFDGIGIYKTFVHVDVRGTKARWNG